MARSTGLAWLAGAAFALSVLACGDTPAPSTGSLATTSSPAPNTDPTAPRGSSTPEPASNRPSHRHAIAASISAVAPDLGDVFGGAPLTITVDSSSDVTAVTIGGTPCTSVAIVDATHVSAIAPAKAAGLYDVTVTNAAGDSAPLARAYEAWHPNVDYATARVFQSDRGVTPVASASRAYSGKIADRLPEGWIDRDGAPILRLSSGRLLMLGGWHLEAWGVSPEGDLTNAIDASDDDGVTWRTLLADDHAPPTSGPGARFLPGHDTGVTLHDAGGTEYVYWIGTDAQSNFRDGGVWRSADGGATWTRISTSAPTANTSLFSVVSYNGNLYVMGGQTDLDDATTAISEVWRSKDDGITWTRLADAPWAGRGGVYWPVVFKGKVFLVGGATYTYYSDERTYFNDVWAFDDAGDTWTQVLANGHQQWEGRHYHSVLVYDQKLWIINGWKKNAVENGSNDVYSSSDGVTWTAYDQIDWYATHAQGAAVTPHGVVMNQGIANESFYVLEEMAGSLVSSWKDQGTGGLTLTQSIANQQPVLAPHALGTQPAIALLGDELMSLPAIDRHDDGGVLEMWVVGRTLNSNTIATTSVPSPLIGCAAPLATSESMTDFGMSGGALVYVDRSNGVRTTVAGSGLSDNQIRLLGAEHRAGSLKLFVGTAQQGENTGVSFDTTYTGWDSIGTDLSIGGAPADKAKFLLGAAVILKTNAPSSATFRVKLNKWVKKWGSTT